MRESVQMDSIKVLIIGANDYAKSVVDKLSFDQNSQELELISVSNQEDFHENAENIVCEQYDVYQLIDIALARRVSLTIPCDPFLFSLAIVDKFREAGLNIFGPTETASKLENCNFFSKEFCHRHKIPTANYASFDSKEMSLVYLQNIKYPVLIKPANIFERDYENKQFLAKDFNEAKSFVDLYYSKLYLSNSNKKLIIEEYEESREISIPMIFDGENAFSFIPIKNIFEFNRVNFNFNEMAAFSSEESFQTLSLDLISKKIIEPAIEGLKSEGLEFSGVISFNCKISDEDRVELKCVTSFLSNLNAQIILNLLDENLFDLFFSCSQSKLSFYKEGLHRFPEAAVAYNLIYDYSIFSSLSDEDIESLEIKALEDGYKLIVKNIYDEQNNRDLIKLICFAANSFEAKNYDLKTIKKLNLAGKEYIND